MMWVSFFSTDLMLKDDMGPDFRCNQDRDHSIYECAMRCKFEMCLLCKKSHYTLLPSNFSNKLARKWPQEEP